MKAIATELVLFWESHGTRPIGEMYSRYLPDGTLAVITLGYEGESWLSVDGAEIGEYQSQDGAIIAAGRIAREQLAAMANEWTNIGSEVAA